MRMLTFSEYREAYGYASSTLGDWLREGLIPGAEKVDGVWRIPEGARPHYKPRGKRDRSFGDNAYDFLKALNTYRYADAKVLHCRQSDFDDMVAELERVGWIAPSSTPGDGVNNTGYALTASGRVQIQLSKRAFLEVLSAVIAGVTSAMLDRAGQ